MRVAVLVFSACVCAYAILLQERHLRHGVAAYQVTWWGLRAAGVRPVLAARDTQGAVFSIVLGLLAWLIFMHTPPRYISRATGRLHDAVVGMVLARWANRRCRTCTARTIAWRARSSRTSDHRRWIPIVGRRIVRPVIAGRMRPMDQNQCCSGVGRHRPDLLRSLGRDGQAAARRAARHFPLAPPRFRSASASLRTSSTRSASGPSPRPPRCTGRGRSCGTN